VNWNDKVMNDIEGVPETIVNALAGEEGVTDGR
jgi:hypothetical protein